ncbi:MAG: hypothetical protein D6772_13625 [Bacteroidetes bacterium]|nr:MAG: hypothetical protein D6772_13625 [Bacteroidota bacterium]
MQRHQHLAHPALRPLWAGLRREWYQKLVALLLLQTACVWLMLRCWDSHLLILAFTIVCNGAVLLATALHLWGPSEFALLRHLLYEQPQRIVWVYTLRTQYRPFGFQFLQQNLIYFKLDNGSDISARLPARRLRLISRILQRALPGTVFGYRPEWEILYQQQPEAFPQAILD